MLCSKHLAIVATADERGGQLGEEEGAETRDGGVDGAADGRGAVVAHEEREELLLHGLLHRGRELRPHRVARAHERDAQLHARHLPLRLAEGARRARHRQQRLHTPRRVARAPRPERRLATLALLVRHAQQRVNQRRHLCLVHQLILVYLCVCSKTTTKEEQKRRREKKRREKKRSQSLRDCAKMTSHRFCCVSCCCVTRSWAVAVAVVAVDPTQRGPGWWAGCAGGTARGPSRPWCGCCSWRPRGSSP